MDFMSIDFDLAENIFYFHNSELKSLAFVLDWDTKEKFYFNLLSVSIVIVVLTNTQAPHKIFDPCTKYFSGPFYFIMLYR